ncbi:diacylglycerol/lipid kinase family protein [Nocardioides faecalis]|uniref:diacylglycerol/lipid kinase family protein n=1 Tax=Nocardioides faecalis TaxID=2803858 RepID=UPI0027DD00E1|nr:diacylglycerol kinase family protein [Nocardioides faecalis]
MPTPSLLLITNAEAGTADVEAVDTALAVLGAIADVEVAATSSPDELDTVLARAGGQRIVVAGGDGSLHAVVAALHRRGELGEAEIALLPLGTGNDFARGLGIPLEPAAAARVILEGATRRLDVVIDDTDTVTVNSVHLGAGADAGAKGAVWKERLGSVGVGKLNLGRLGYPIGTLQTALKPPTLRVRVEVDGELLVDLDQQVLMIAIGNGTSVGGGTALTPDALPHDGALDVLIATPVGTWARLAYLLRLPFASHEKHEDVKIVRGCEVRVAGTPFDCNSDGEISGPVRRRTWRVVPDAYTMVLPAESGATASGN